MYIYTLHMYVYMPIYIHDKYVYTNKHTHVFVCVGVWCINCMCGCIMYQMHVAWHPTGVSSALVSWNYFFNINDKIYDYVNHKNFAITEISNACLSLLFVCLVIVCTHTIWCIAHTIWCITHTIWCIAHTIWCIDRSAWLKKNRALWLLVAVFVAATPCVVDWSFEVTGEEKKLNHRDCGNNGNDTRAVRRVTSGWFKGMGQVTDATTCLSNYGVATISRLLKIIGLFFKRAL